MGHTCCDKPSLQNCMQGVEKTGSQLKEKFFWPEMNTDVNLWCAACEKSQRRQPPAKTKRPAMQIVLPDIPWARVAVDMLGPLPRTAQRSRYVLVRADYFTKWTEVFCASLSPVIKAAHTSCVETCDFMPQFHASLSHVITPAHGSRVDTRDLHSSLSSVITPEFHAWSRLAVMHYGLSISYISPTNCVCIVICTMSAI